VSDIATPIITQCRFTYDEWRKSLALPERQDPGGVPVRHIKRLIGPVEVCLPCAFPGEHYASDVIICGTAVFVRYAEQPGWAVFVVGPDTIIIENKLTCGFRAKIRVTIIEGELMLTLRQLIHASREQQRAWASKHASVGSDPHGAA
jgi:hypothetical protein